MEHLEIWNFYEVSRCSRSVKTTIETWEDETNPFFMYPNFRAKKTSDTHGQFRFKNQISRKDGISQIDSSHFSNNNQQWLNMLKDSSGVSYRMKPKGHRLVLRRTVSGDLCWMITFCICLMIKDGFKPLLNSVLCHRIHLKLQGCTPLKTDMTTWKITMELNNRKCNIDAFMVDFPAIVILPSQSLTWNLNLFPPWNRRFRLWKPSFFNGPFVKHWGG